MSTLLDFLNIENKPLSENDKLNIEYINYVTAREIDISEEGFKRYQACKWRDFETQKEFDDCFDNKPTIISNLSNKYDLDFRFEPDLTKIKDNIGSGINSFKDSITDLKDNVSNTIGFIKISLIIYISSVIYKNFKGKK